jgi:hypothetical protein
MNLTALPAFTDHCPGVPDDGHAAVVVDPADSASVLAAYGARHLTLAAILVTRHQADPVGSVDVLMPHLTKPVLAEYRQWNDNFR